MTLPPQSGGKAEVLAVREYGPAKGGSTYQVTTLQAAAPAVSSPRQVVVPAKGHLAITVQKGEGVGAIARRFAASHDAPEPRPSGGRGLSPRHPQGQRRQECAQGRPGIGSCRSRQTPAPC